MNPDDNYAANFASKMCAVSSNEYFNLTALMCWDAVKYCALKAGIIDQNKYNRLQGKYDLVSPTDQVIVGANAMYRLERGNVIGFYWQDNNDTKLVHAMISLGKGLAAGNKNDCVGVGQPVSWEKLDLSNKLNWADDGTIIAPGCGPNGRTLTARKRPISYLRFS